MSATVDSLLPLSFLEAVRNVDTPVEDFEAELVSDLRNKRLGLSDTVYMQIKRFTDAVKRHQRTSHDEAAGLAKLIGRRPDAEAVFRAAGRYLAREAYQTISPMTRRILLALPALLARPIALRHTRRLSRRYFNGRVTRIGSSVYLEVERSVTQEAAPRSVGCTYYEAGLREMLRLMVNSVGTVEHVRCSGRGEGACAWRAEWRPSAEPTESATA
jgi:predicted hydrocarbon binding protein